MTPLLRYILPLTALILSACDGGYEAPPTLSPKAAAEYLQVCERLEDVVQKTFDQLDEARGFFEKEDEMTAIHRRLGQEILDLLDAYGKSGDAALTTPTMHQTMLHFAVQHRMETLVDELLRQGADPNAVCDVSYMGLNEMDAPLVWTILPDVRGDELAHMPYRETAIRLIDRLVAGGARTNDDAGGHALLFCSISRHEGAEDVYLHLLEQGANPRLGYMRHTRHGNDDEEYFQQAVGFFLHSHWPRALRKLIDMGHLPAEWRNEHKKTLLFILVEEHVTELREGCRDEDAAAGRLSLIRVLLECGAGPNTPQGGGWTPLNYAACLRPNEPEFAPEWQELIDLLLSHGGNTAAIVPAHLGNPARTVAEYLADAVQGSSAE